jgi:hypothetical protein
VCETILNGERNNVSFQGGDMLKSTRNMDLLIINIILIPFKLASGMDGSTFDKLLNASESHAKTSAE